MRAESSIAASVFHLGTFLDKVHIVMQPVSVRVVCLMVVDTIEY